MDISETPYSHDSDDADQHVTIDATDSVPSKPSRLDYELDPLLRLEQHARSTHQAIVYVIAVPLITLAVAGILLYISHNQGGPNCDAGESAWICSRLYEILFPTVPGTIALIGALGGVWTTYFKWSRYDRWRPWLATCWVLIPFALGWMTSTGWMAIAGLDYR
ncbi:hypothetical protein ACGE24_06860 [Corynebacterium kroppenstedtii]|uniref:hypothetical protein n=1 Tax=Corynebacterium sp. PCR 32 TaxID=3351342 RepID=UPI00309586A0